MNTLELAQQLINIPSITPADNGSQELMITFLESLGFTITRLPVGDVSNFLAQLGSEKPIFAFAGHTDVVPPGAIEQWNSPPFTATINNNKLYGRGAADMKSSLAAMLIATRNFLAKNKSPHSSIAFIITSDEEGVAENGTKRIVEYLQKNAITLDYCLIGEATCVQQLGDTIKTGRRGSLSAKLIIHGKQGHIAYPHLALNPIHQALDALKKIITEKWDEADVFFPATSLQISNIHAGTGAENIIPAELIIDFNLRYSPAISAEIIQQKINELLQTAQLKYDLQWHHSGKPFFSTPNTFVDATLEAIKKITSIKANNSTAGGTSDGRFLIDISKQLLEFGPINASIHQVNEHINIDDLEQLTLIYENILQNVQLLR